MASATHLGQLFNESIVLLDGGLGTTLETYYSKAISNTPLWSANVITEDPEAVIKAHIAFLEAGAKVLMTATYQCAFETFGRGGYSKEEAIEIWRKGVQLADEARRRFVQERNLPDDSIRIALSIGPFGSTLVPTQEFDGFYPPPYGPQAYTTDGQGRNSFLPGEEDKETTAVQALAEFHFERLKAYLSDSATWGMIDLLAFETVPVLREITAIRKAVQMVEAEITKQGQAVTLKPWWISGRAQQVAQTALGGAVELPRPTGLGINCCGVEFMSELAHDMGQAVREYNLERPPILVLYPNGGDVYDTVLRQWKKGRDKAHWADELDQVVRKVKDAWGGVIVGGCCRTGPEEIRALGQVFSGS
ncbi:hypothetical protein HGRIS_003178 [Hohenbuehelia grisea]|uniref:Hcy-binding domain-containing protein n=1 Tax=Hohenbuehelia grisea TaxID=104357 RepID=A0ABR3JNK3_9AGAR